MALQPLILCFQDDIEKVSRIGFPTTYTTTPLQRSQLQRRCMIRWGKSLIVPDSRGGKADWRYVLNSSRAIRVNINKVRALERMRDAGVITPTIYTERVPLGKLAVVRPVNHAEGSHFNVVRGRYQIPDGHYGTSFLESPRGEARIWFVRTGNGIGHTLCAERVPLAHQEVGRYPCRSKWGYEFMPEVPHPIHDHVLKAATAIGLDCGAADVLLIGREGVIVELNSSPTVDALKVRQFYFRHLPLAIQAKWPRLKVNIPRAPLPGLLPIVR